MSPPSKTRNDPETEIKRILDSLGESVAFCASGKGELILPGLQVDGVGPVGLPISQSQAKQLIEQAERAPYGKGEETVLDTDVRRVWQLDPSAFQLTSPKWSRWLGNVATTVKKEFGLSNKVKAELYKLLVYEEGSFFAAHRDSEKTDGMFATLIVCLPSAHQGGELVITHQGQTETVDFSCESEDQIQYAAFYADCQHEIKPVTTGYRVCLVYNLSLAAKRQRPEAPSFSQESTLLRENLEHLFAAGLQKLAVPLEHQYTQAGVNADSLKGSDRAKVAALAQATQGTDWECYLGLLTLYQSGLADTSYVDPRRYFDEDRVGIQEVYDETLAVDSWSEPSGEALQMGAIHFLRDEIVGVDPEELPRKQTVHEATGNEGVTVERWYRAAMVCLWPKANRLSIWLGDGPPAAVPALARALRNKEPQEQCHHFAAAIIDSWTNEYRRDWRREDRDSQSPRMLSCLAKLADLELAERFVAEVLVSDYQGKEGRALGQLCKAVEWEKMTRPLITFFEAQNYGSGNLMGAVELFVGLCSYSKKPSPAQRCACQELAWHALGMIQRWDRDESLSRWYRSDGRRAEILESLVPALTSVDAREQLGRFVEHAIATHEHYDLRTVLIPTMKKLRKSFDQEPAFEQLLESCRQRLQAATAEPIVVPDHWSQNVTLKCDCELCHELQTFLRDPIETVHHFRVNKECRKHIHRTINANELDVTHVTDRRGRPYTLVCTKNRASYTRAQKQFKGDQRVLKELDKWSKNG